MKSCIESRDTGGDALDNLATLCKDCHSDYRDAAFMGVMRLDFYSRLKEEYANVSLTFRYTAKNTRIRNSLGKDHAVDARCTGGNPTSAPLDAIYKQKAVRRRNRQLHKATIIKG
ncbi:MAG: hypothetical protein LBU32_26935 [Clostridiales bacterium]|nr:hypothetical protein [Clostridiales bacterium]